MSVPSSKCMRLHRSGARLVAETRPLPAPQPGQLLLRVRACGVCRTDLHVVDGDLPFLGSPLVPGHEIVGEVLSQGDGVSVPLGARLGVPWLGAHPTLRTLLVVAALNSVVSLFYYFRVAKALFLSAPAEETPDG